MAASSCFTLNTPPRRASGTISWSRVSAGTDAIPAAAPTPTIASATTTADALVIQLRDASPATRVSVIGRRYEHDGWRGGKGLSPFTPPLPENLRPGFLTCGFLTDRRLSDEMRYILDRRALNIRNLHDLDRDAC